jgi:hypothetical protein
LSKSNKKNGAVGKASFASLGLLRSFIKSKLKIA